MGAVEEIHDRERELIGVLAVRLLAYLRERDGAVELEAPIEAEWGRVRFRVQVANAPIVITLRVDP